MDETRWRVSTDEARRDFRALIDSVLQESAHVTITRYGTPVAVIVPIGWYEQARSQLSGEAPPG
jgi:prevent-host-death family protein